LPAFAKSSLEQLAAEEKRKQQSIRDEANRKSREKTDEDKAAKKAAAVAAKAKAAAEAEEKTGQLNMFPIPSDLGNAA
jgi:glucose-6-phosphate isomerase